MYYESIDGVLTARQWASHSRSLARDLARSESRNDNRKMSRQAGVTRLVDLLQAFRLRD